MIATTGNWETGADSTTATSGPGVRGDALAPRAGRDHAGGAVLALEGSDGPHLLERELHPSGQRSASSRTSARVTSVAPGLTIRRGVPSSIISVGVST